LAIDKAGGLTVIIIQFVVGPHPHDLSALAIARAGG
jgi:hypothetical protein